jgi:uncharacterized membrane protein YfcA
MSKETGRRPFRDSAGAVDGVEKKGSINWPRLALNIGGVIDALMGFVFLVPALRVLIFGENAQFHTPQYEWAMRLIASLGFAWTALLFWAARKPLERKEVLLFTVVPLMLGAFSATAYGFITSTIPARFFALFTVVTLTMCPFYIVVFLGAGKLQQRRRMRCP